MTLRLSVPALVFQTRTFVLRNSAVRSVMKLWKGVNSIGESFFIHERRRARVVRFGRSTNNRALWRRSTTLNVLWTIHMKKYIFYIELMKLRWRFREKRYFNHKHVVGYNFSPFNRSAACIILWTRLNMWLYEVWLRQDFYCTKMTIVSYWIEAKRVFALYCSKHEHVPQSTIFYLCS